MANKLIQDLGAGAFALTDLLEHQPIAGPPSLKGDVAALVTLLNTIYQTSATPPGGADTQVQFNDGGVFGGDAGLVFNKTTDALTGLGTFTAPTFVGALTGAASLNVLKAGDTMTGLLTIAQATANTSAFVSTGYSLTGANAQSLLSLAGTWNTSGNPVAIRLAVTNTASGATSKLLELLAGAAGATSMFSVDKAGSVTAAGSGTFSALIVANNSFIAFGNARPYMDSATTENIALHNLAGTGFGLLQFGGVTSAFPALKRSSALLQCRLADDSAYCDLEARMLRLATAFTVATLPAAGTQGRMTYVTDALTPTFLTAAVGGGAVISPVFDNGTAWVTV